MSIIKSACAYANNSVAIIAWEAYPDHLSGCLGFEITRVYQDPAQGARILAAWVPFEGQSNPDWKPQDTSVWPVQKFTWRDLTVRQRRDDASLRALDQPMSYRIRPVCDRKDGLRPVEVVLPATYTGEPRLLSYMDDGMFTDVVTPTTTFGPFQVAFNSGILSTQWLSHAVEKKTGRPTNARSLVPLINTPADPIRDYLAGDLPTLVEQMFKNLAPKEKVYLALYELTDAVLVDLILKNAPKVHLILSNTSLDKKLGEWDTENSPCRTKLHEARPALAEMHDRMFNNNQHIGHNKFVVRAGEDGKAISVLSGSTNWTANGLCAQSNNMYIARVPELAEQFLTYWHDLKGDNDSFEIPDPLSQGSNNVQGAELRQTNANALPPVIIQQWGVKLWRSPNTKRTTKPSSLPALPPDLAEVFGYIRQAKKAIFFAAFLPSQQGLNSIISEAIDIARKDTSLMVYGAISDPMAMPNYITRQERADSEDDNPDDKYQPSIFEEGQVHIVRANALGGDLIGNFEQEVLSAGHAIIHDKLLVIDPLSDECVVVVGSHNLGFKASYANDDNLLIIRRNKALAQSYMVHVLDLYEHYRFRGVQYERRHDGQRDWSGFLATNNSWADKYPGGASDLSRYLAGSES